MTSVEDRSKSHRTVRHVYVLGFDGMTLDLVKPWVEEGELPGFARMMKDGAWGALQSVVPPLSAQAWTSFATGKNPGKHGIRGFFECAPDSYDVRFLNARFRLSTPIWQLLGQTGRRVGVMNVPMTYPPDAVNGFMLSGFDSPGAEKSEYSYPQVLKRQVADAIGPYIIEPAPNLTIEEYIAMWHMAIERRLAAMRYLQDRFSPDFLMVVFMASDRVQHFFWKDMDSGHPMHSSRLAARYGDVILEVYKHLDRVLTDVMEQLEEEDLLIVMSDHGAGGRSNVTIHLNRILEDCGFLRFHSARAGSVEGLKRSMAAFMGRFYYRTARRARRYVPASVRTAVTRSRLFRNFRDEALSGRYLAGVDWSRTKAFAVGPYIYVNAQETRPQGIVEIASEYDALCEEIAQALGRVRHPVAGGKLVDKVYKGEELFLGDNMDGAPDLVVSLRDEEYALSIEPIAMAKGRGWFSQFGRADFEGERFKRQSGSHRVQGLFMAMGRDIKQGQVHDMKIVDCAPTILYAFGEPIPRDMDGTVRVEIFEESFRQDNSLRYIGREIGAAQEEVTTGAEGYSEDDARAVRDRLEGLGYI